MEDCYFWIQHEKNDSIMNVMCVDCHKEKPEITAWFWPGSTKGYGPFDYECEFCKKIIKTKKD